MSSAIHFTFTTDNTEHSFVRHNAYEPFSGRSHRGSYQQRSQGASGPTSGQGHKLHITKHNESVQGTFTLLVPPSQPQALATPGDDAASKEIVLRTSNGSIGMRINVVQQGDQDSDDPVEMELSTSNGSIRVGFGVVSCVVLHSAWCLELVTFPPSHSLREKAYPIAVPST